MRFPSCVSWPLVMLLLACGQTSADPDSTKSDAGSPDSSPSEYVICDGSNNLRFGYQVLGGGMMPLGAALLSQNGFAYLFIDGACRYWAFGANNVGEAQYWQATHTGTLSAQEIAELAQDLDVSTWSDAKSDAQGPFGCLDGSTALLWREGVLMGSNCGMGPAADTAKKTRVWLDKLWNDGAPVEGELRLEAFQIPIEMDDPNRPSATLAMDLAAVALPDSAGLSQDDPALLVSDPALVAELRKQRERVIAGDYVFQGDPLTLPVRQNQIAYFLFFRDVIPLEDENGLIRLGQP